MKKYSLLLIFMCGITSFTAAQYKYEREHRIRQSQFPQNALAPLQEKLQDAKHIRFYKEIDSSKIHYEIKFKKDRLHYNVEFQADGQIEYIQLLVKSVDIPDETFKNFNTYLKRTFAKHRIRKIEQRYVARDTATLETTIKNAFQNLILPSIRYELIVTGKKSKIHESFKILFDAEGSFISIKKLLPANYDHVLY